MLNAWFISHETCRSPLVKDLLEGLEKSGVKALPNNEGNIRGYGIVFIDNITPQLLKSLEYLSNNRQARVIAVVTENAGLNDESIWALFEIGISDVIRLDSDVDAVKEIVSRFERWGKIEKRLSEPEIRKNLIGNSTAWQSFLRQIVEIAEFPSASILLTGESGTGKELAARLVHYLDPRPKKPDLVILDCTNIHPNLSGSEFFGHERGAFTGAATARDGVFALADGGTLFLDEVGDLPLDLQAQLLRVIQERAYRRVGGNSWHKTDFRLICATHKDLRGEVGKGNFRHDLYYRIASWTCTLPPLRERTEDIVPLAMHFIRTFPDKRSAAVPDESVIRFLQRRSYPGNVRELQQLVWNIIYRSGGAEYISPGCIPEDERPRPGNGLSVWNDSPFEHCIHRAVSFGVGLHEIGETAKKTAVDIALRKVNNAKKAAKMLNVTDRTVQNYNKTRKDCPQAED